MKNKAYREQMAVNRRLEKAYRKDERAAWKRVKRAEKRENRLERIEARHQARLRRIKEGDPYWLRLVMGVLDVGLGEFFKMTKY